ncbi:MAG: Uma2 family endonuclease [Acetobacteraceae bacterium]
MSHALKLPVRMTVQEFLEWDSGDGLRYELADGEPRAMAPASAIHAALQSELNRLLGNHLRQHRPGCRVLTNPGVLPRMLSAQNFRSPDLGVTCSALSLGQATMPDPILLVEILSPSNQAKTWSNVWAYTSIPILQEILVLHSTRVTAEILRRNADRQWPQDTLSITGGDLFLDAIKFRVPLAEIYEGTGITG